MGRHDKVISDPNLAHEHAAGATITLLQPLVHDRLSAMSSVWPRHWVMHLRQADKGRDDLAKLHERLDTFPVGPGNARDLPVDDYLFDVYAAGCEMVLHVCLTVQHLAEEIERTAHLPLHARASMRRTTDAAAPAGSDRIPRVTESICPRQSPTEPPNGFTSTKSRTMGIACLANAGSAFELPVDLTFHRTCVEFDWASLPSERPRTEAIVAA